jgi:hypothetical protein
LPGPEGGAAIAKLLFGSVNPSGKLPFDYISQTGQRHLQYGSFAHTALWEFGHGLSYTTFSISDIATTAGNGTFELKDSKNQFLDVSVTVENTGKVRGKEVIILSMTELFSQTPAPQQLLMTKRFTKVEFNPGQRRRLTFRLNGSDFRYSIPATGAAAPLNITARIGSNINSPVSVVVTFMTTLQTSSWPESEPENMPENVTRPSCFLPPDAAPPVDDSPFAPPPIQPPLAPPTTAAPPTDSNAPPTASAAPEDPWSVPPFSFEQPPESTRAPVSVRSPHSAAKTSEPNPALACIFTVILTVTFTQL